jgi:hypothetical protein
MPVVEATATVAPSASSQVIPTRSPVESATPATSRATPAPSLSATPSPTEPAEQDDDALFSAALLAYFRREFVAAWNGERSTAATEEDIARAEASFRAQVRRSPSVFGRRAAAAANRVDARDAALKTGDALTLLQIADDNQWSPTPADLTDAFIDKVFASKSAGTTVGPDATNDLVLDGTTVQLGYGAVKGRVPGLSGWGTKAFPKDLTIAGQGIDATVIKLSDYAVKDDIERLTIRDLTINAADNYVFDKRSGNMTIRLERVRIIGFDMGAGGSVAFGVEGMLLEAKQCQFLGGYGRSPGSGNLLRGGPIVCRFTDCTFKQLRSLELDEMKAGLFTRCVIDGIGWFDADHYPNVKFDACTVTNAPVSWTELGVKRDIKELFPNWGD